MFPFETAGLAQDPRFVVVADHRGTGRREAASHPPLPVPSLDRDNGGAVDAGEGRMCTGASPRYFAPTKKTVPAEALAAGDLP